MFDIHYHLIFGVDDGPKSIEDSLHLAEASIAEGVDHIVASPHASDRYRYQPEVNLERLAMIREHVDGRLTLGLGCDFHLSSDNLAALQSDPKRFTINGTNYLLVEFPEFVQIPAYTNVLFQVMSLGIVPIITHPERNRTFLDKPSAIFDWVQSGCLTQITAASYLGRFGKSSQSFAYNLTRSNLVHFVASDAHSVAWRAPAMAEAFNIIQKDFGQETAERLCTHNPRAVFFGKPLPPQPDTSTELYQKHMKKKGFFSRLLR